MCRSLLGTPSVMTCCGVCQYEGRHCALMAPPGAMEAHIKEYSEDFGFDFEAFSPAELFARLQGVHRHMSNDTRHIHDGHTEKITALCAGLLFQGFIRISLSNLLLLCNRTIA
jgi:hypothetical protein